MHELRAPAPRARGDVRVGDARDRALARRIEGKPGLTAALQQDLEDVHHRLVEVDVLQQRVAELEERIDFAERLLARGESQATLPRATPP